MNNKLELVQSRFVESVGRISDVFGINRFVAQMYAFLYLKQGPLSLGEIAEAFGASKGNVSINIRILEKWGAVRNVWMKGSRKDYYEVESDIKKVFFNNLKTTIDKRLEEVSNMIQDFDAALQSVKKDSLSEADKKAAMIYEERLRKLDEFRKLILGALSLAGSL